MSTENNTSGMPPRKLDKLLAYMRAGAWGPALRLAASWPQLGVHKDSIRQGWAAYSRPAFYRQIGKDPDILVAVGIQALKERYGKFLQEGQ